MDEYALAIQRFKFTKEIEEAADRGPWDTYQSWYSPTPLFLDPPPISRFLEGKFVILTPFKCINFLPILGHFDTF